MSLYTFIGLWDIPQAERDVKARRNMNSAVTCAEEERISRERSSLCNVERVTKEPKRKYAADNVLSRVLSRVLPSIVWYVILIFNMHNVIEIDDTQNLDCILQRIRHNECIELTFPSKICYIHTELSYNLPLVCIHCISQHK